MCRSKSEGGRRCPGRTATATRTSTRTGSARTGAPTTRTATGIAAPMRPVLVVEDETQTYAAAATTPRTTPPEAGRTGVPTRQRTDELAATYPADATGWDGKPLSPVDRRLYALRDAGWKGPIDQDGYPDTTSEGAGILRRMAQRRGEHPAW
jgi:hypothetical protein